MVDAMEKALSVLANRISALSQEYEGTKGEKKEQTIRKDVVLFFSFDVVNSTAYKTIDYYGWAQALNLLFKELRKEVHKEISGSEMWRVLGDEAIFVVKIRDEDELRKYVNRIFKILISTIFKLKKGEFFNYDNNFNLKRLQNILSLKAAAWIAAVTDVGDISEKDVFQQDTDNIFEHYRSSEEGHEIFEFLGNDIDAGFRVAKQTQDGRMVISYELAHLIAQKTESLSYLHIITYKRLKGIWKDKLYPIIWYHDPQMYLEYYSKEIQLEESFTFDAYDESELIKEYYDNRDQDKMDNPIRNKRMYLEPYYALNKIAHDRELKEKIDRLQQLIKESTIARTKYINTELMQFHCVAVCYQIDNEGPKILVAKRSENRSKHSGEWEFGCAKAVINKSIEEKIKEEYRKDFGIEIQPLLDENRTLKEPVPLAIYHVDKEDAINGGIKQDKGIITLAEVIGNYDFANFQPTDKHEQVKWIREQELSNLDIIFEKKVPDFEQTLRSAFDKIKSF